MKITKIFFILFFIYSNIYGYTKEEKLIVDFINNSFLGNRPLNIRFSIYDLYKHKIINGKIDYLNMKEFDIFLDKGLNIFRRDNNIFAELKTIKIFIHIDLKLLLSIKELTFLKNIKTNDNFRKFIFSKRNKYIMFYEKESKKIHLKIKDKNNNITHIWFEKPFNLPVKVTEYNDKNELLRKTIMKFSYIQWDIREHRIKYKKLLKINSKNIDFLITSIKAFFNKLK